MLIRDANGKIVIIFRKDCKNELFYNTKIYSIIDQYREKFVDYSSIVSIPPKYNIKQNQKFNINKRQKYTDESNDECSDTDNDE